MCTLSPLVSNWKDSLRLVASKGIIELIVTIGEWQTAKTKNVEFMVMVLKSSYTIILGIPTQCSFGILASVPHYFIEYHNENGAEVIRSNPESILQQIVKTRKDMQNLVLTSPVEQITYKSSVKIEPSRNEAIDVIIDPLICDNLILPAKIHATSSPMANAMTYDH